jgi:hypothetical protein
MRRLMVLAAACLCLVGVLSGRAGAEGSPAVASATVADASPSGAACHDFLFPVTVRPADSKWYEVFGRLCAAAEPAATVTLASAEPMPLSWRRSTVVLPTLHIRHAGGMCGTKRQPCPSAKRRINQRVGSREVWVNA